MRNVREGSVNTNSVALQSAAVGMGPTAKSTSASGASRAQVTRNRYRIRSALFLAALALTSCATQTRYVQTYCISQDQYAKLKSAEPGKIGSQLNGNAQHDFKLAAGQDVALQAYADGLLGVIGGCVDPNTEAPAK